jgi:hypothetical protein
MTELISLFITQVIPLIMKEYANLSQKGEFTDAQRAALDAQIASYSDFVANPAWKPDA